MIETDPPEMTRSDYRNTEVTIDTDNPDRYSTAKPVERDPRKPFSKPAATTHPEPQDRTATEPTWPEPAPIEVKDVPSGDSSLRHAEAD